MNDLRNVRCLMLAVAGFSTVDLVAAVMDQDWVRLFDKITILFLCVTVWTLTKTADHDRERP